jgi:hypothetical protein
VRFLIGEFWKLILERIFVRGGPRLLAIWAHPRIRSFVKRSDKAHIAKDLGVGRHYACGNNFAKFHRNRIAN